MNYNKQKRRKRQIQTKKDLNIDSNIMRQNKCKISIMVKNAKMHSFEELKHESSDLTHILSGLITFKHPKIIIFLFYIFKNIYKILHKKKSAVRY